LKSLISIVGTKKFIVTIIRDFTMTTWHDCIKLSALQITMRTR